MNENVSCDLPWVIEGRRAVNATVGIHSNIQLNEAVAIFIGVGLFASGIAYLFHYVST